MNGGILDRIKKIGVIRANALGDLIFILPALAALKRTYPDAELVLLAREWHRTFLASRPSPVDRVIVLPPIRGLSAPDNDRSAPSQTPPDVLEGLRAERFDLLVQMHGGGERSNPFLKEIGAPTIVGLVADGSEPLDRSIRYRYFQNETLRYLEVAALAGAAPVDIMPHVAVTPDDVKEASSALSGHGRFVVLHPGATDVRRRWAAKKFAWVGDALASRGYRVVITGDGNERELVRAVADEMRFDAVALDGVLSLGGLAGVLKGASVVIGNDTGPLHLARAVETPTVTLYWIGNAINGGPLFHHRHRAVMSWTIACPVCSMTQIDTRCEHDPSFLDSIAPAAVLAQAEDLLASQYGVQARGKRVANLRVSGIDATRASQ
ncbi:MAG TPA: glycosyltransferase family 9 protein [Candidatus Aquilonibacter sp.]|nr:glycosyltransferase family 9 protein [Candidatus Aquilonibacter sp.]